MSMTTTITYKAGGKAVWTGAYPEVLLHSVEVWSDDGGHRIAEIEMSTIERVEFTP